MSEPDHAGENGSSPASNRLGALGQAVGHTRFAVLIAVAAVLLVAVSLFLLGAFQAVVAVAEAWAMTLRHGEQAHLSIEFLEIVIVMLEAVAFFLIGVGLYSLFISPLNLAIALGVETLNDLEERVISVVVAVLAVTFLQHFIRWEEPLETLQFGAALAIAVASLVLFQMYSQRAKEDQKGHKPDTQQRSKRDMFQRDQEQHEIKPYEVKHETTSARHDRPQAKQQDSKHDPSSE